MEAREVKMIQVLNLAYCVDFGDLEALLGSRSYTLLPRAGEIPSSTLAEQSKCLSFLNLFTSIPGPPSNL